MTESSPSPGIRASLNEAGELVLTAMNAPPEAVIRMDVNADSPRMLCTQGRYLAPVQAPPGARIRFRLFRGKRGITPPETFIMPGTPPARAVPSTLIPCTQDRDFMIYDWASRHEAACRIVRETHPNLLFIGDSITHFWGGAPVDEPHRDILQKSPETWNLCTAGMRAVNLGFGYDRVENALWRLRHGELDGAEDNAVCVVLLGTNNLAENTVGNPGRHSCRLPGNHRQTGKSRHHPPGILPAQQRPGRYGGTHCRHQSPPEPPGHGRKFHLYGTGTRHG